MSSTAEAMNKEPHFMTLGLPAWINHLDNEQKRELAAIGRIRMRRANAITAGMTDNMRDDVVIANLLFHVADKSLLKMMLVAYERDHAIFAED